MVIIFKYYHHPCSSPATVLQSLIVHRAGPEAYRSICQSHLSFPPSQVFSFASVRPLVVLLDVPKLKYIRFTYISALSSRMNCIPMFPIHEKIAKSRICLARAKGQAGVHPVKSTIPMTPVRIITCAALVTVCHTDRNQVINQSKVSISVLVVVITGCNTLQIVAECVKIKLI